MHKSSTEYIHRANTTDEVQPAKIPTALLIGRVIGRYMDTNIYDQLTDDHGQVWKYTGVTDSAHQCKPGVIITKPGVIYSLDPVRKKVPEEV